MIKYTDGNFDITATSMTRYEYAVISKEIFSDTQLSKLKEWKLWDGFYCDWNGYKFWKDSIKFYEQYQRIDNDSTGNL